MSKSAVLLWLMMTVCFMTQKYIFLTLQSMKVCFLTDNWIRIHFTQNHQNKTRNSWEKHEKVYLK